MYGQNMLNYKTISKLAKDKKLIKKLRRIRLGEIIPNEYYVLYKDGFIERKGYSGRERLNNYHRGNYIFLRLR